MEYVRAIEQSFIHLLDQSHNLADDVGGHWVYRLHFADNQPEPSDFIGENAEKMTQLFASAIKTKR